MTIMRWFAVFLLVVVGGFYALSFRNIPAHIEYGASFSKLHADELQLDWKAV